MSKFVMIRLTTKQHKELKKAAKEASKPVSTLARELVFARLAQANTIQLVPPTVAESLL